MSVVAEEGKTNIVKGPGRRIFTALRYEKVMSNMALCVASRRVYKGRCFEIDIVIVKCHFPLLGLTKVLYEVELPRVFKQKRVLSLCGFILMIV